MDRDAGPGQAQVLADEAGAAGELGRFAVEQEAAISQGCAETRVDRQGAGRAVDVELGVAARGAVVLGGQIDQLLAGAVEGAGHGLEQGAALGEAHRAQGRAADGAGVGEGRAEIEIAGGRLGDGGLGGRVDQGVGLARARVPAVAEVRLKADHRAVLRFVEGPSNTPERPVGSDGAAGLEQAGLGVVRALHRLGQPDLVGEAAQRLGGGRELLREGDDEGPAERRRYAER